MIDRIISHFVARPATCFSYHTDAQFHVYDPEGNVPCRRRDGEPQETDLAVHNTGDSVVHLVAIDHCLYGPADTARCDCALVCNEEIHFVEFKHGKNKNRAERLRECIPQLAAAISEFYTAGIIAPNSIVWAITCVGFAEQRPPQTAAVEARKLQLNRLVPDAVAVELLVANSTTFGEKEVI